LVSGGAAGGSSGKGNVAEPPKDASGNFILKDANGNVIPREFDAPKFDFVVQFAWKPRDLAAAQTGAVAAAPAAPTTAGPTPPATPVDDDSMDN
jgi:hypothetical protein